MRKPGSVKSLENLGRVRLSKHFFMRDFLYSEVAGIFGLSNIPDDPELAIAAGSRLCEELLEPITDAFGPIAVRSAYRSAEVNRVCNEEKENCSSNEKNHARHIWDVRDREGHIGAMACIVIPWYLDYSGEQRGYEPLAWWIHDHLNYSEVMFFSKLFAFNLGWHEKPKRTIHSWKGGTRTLLTKPGMDNQEGSHAALYLGLPSLGGVA
ncbi:MAG: hypothetical protein H7Y22_17895 [Gemmatimonadaceae bacterium]|nr:hypothetical protein [Gloeobacterales cyanobacterium ES-bin-141]